LALHAQNNQTMKQFSFLVFSIQNKSGLHVSETLTINITISNKH